MTCDFNIARIYKRNQYSVTQSERKCDQYFTSLTIQCSIKNPRFALDFKSSKNKLRHCYFNIHLLIIKIVQSRNHS